jgi:hypothetical protein
MPLLRVETFKTTFRHVKLYKSKVWSKFSIRRNNLSTEVKKHAPFLVLYRMLVGLLFTTLNYVT